MSRSPSDSEALVVLSVRAPLPRLLHEHRSDSARPATPDPPPCVSASVCDHLILHGRGHCCHGHIPEEETEAQRSLVA